MQYCTDRETDREAKCNNWFTKVENLTCANHERINHTANKENEAGERWQLAKHAKTNKRSQHTLNFDMEGHVDMHVDKPKVTTKRGQLHGKLRAYLVLGMLIPLGIEHAWRAPVDTPNIAH